MFRFCRREGKGECLATLKSLIGRRTVKIELRDGLMFIDEVIGVVGDAGTEVAVFTSNRRVAVGDIDLVEPA